MAFGDVDLKFCQAKASFLGHQTNTYFYTFFLYCSIAYVEMKGYAIISQQKYSISNTTSSTFIENHQYRQPQKDTKNRTQCLKIIPNVSLHLMLILIEMVQGVNNIV